MKKHPLTLLIMILLSSVLIGVSGAILKYQVLRQHGIQREESIMEIPFLLLADDSLRSELAEQPTEPAAQPEQTEQPQQTEQPGQPEETEPAGTEPAAEIATEPEVAAGPVEPEWFDDALFIGDSRTVGLRYVDLLGEAHYFCDVGMTVYAVQSSRCYDDGFGYKYLRNVLDEHTYGKVFIHLGLNECTGIHDKVIAKYQELVDMVREKQPDAVIILQEIMTVVEWKAQVPGYTLPEIQSLNDRIKAIADGDENIYFIQTNEWLIDEEGYMRDEISNDGSHLTGEGYTQWAEYLLEEAGELGIS